MSTVSTGSGLSGHAPIAASGTDVASASTATTAGRRPSTRYDGKP
ncbi:hypothetical protein [Demequina sp. NBRC 110054]|nr:hypothetical protein [Demequina sp. NBRC 110054]